MQEIPEITVVVGGFLLLILHLWAATWAIGDAQRRGQTGCLVLLVFYLFGFAGALVWLIVRPNSRLTERKFKEYATADDALAAASQLSTQGEWDAAIALYQTSAEKWPEHRAYATACIQQIEERKRL